MRAIDIVNRVLDCKGQHVRAIWSRLAETLESSQVIVTKTTKAWVRSGISYRNLESVKAGIESGERGDVEPLKWGHWREGYRNYIIDHTPKGQTESVEYVRLYPATFDNLKVPEVTWTLNGKPATFEQVEPHLLAKEKRESRDVKCFTLKAESVLDIN